MKTEANDFFLVGIGGSSGGIQAMQTFFESMPFLPNIAFVAITHLSRGYASNLSAILARYTPYRVIAVKEDVQLASGNIYVITEDSYLECADGKLLKRPRPKESDINRAVDIFLLSLAETFRERAIAVILSGGGNDGLKGAVAVEKRGGLVMSQSPISSQFPQMPLAVIRDNNPAAVLEPAALAEAVVQRVHEKSTNRIRK
ncbi:chemotaxis protein CheB [Olivibacter sp. SA151]|uniref:chemotaxis protein CheB n=1 Tax=Olivibacter jilunii TaxID=985016 RepID=UPI003F17EB75